MKFFPFFLRVGPLAGLLLLSPGLRAASAEPPVVTLADALRRAEENNPSLSARRYGERAADGLIEQAGYRPNPTLDVSLENALGTGAVQGVRGLEATVQASQTLERGDKRRKRVALASRERDVAAGEYALLRTEILSSVALAYVEFIAAQDRLSLSEESLRLAKETLVAVDARAKAGAASAAETARARAALAAARGERAGARAALEASRGSLSATWGGVFSEPLSVAGHIRLPDTPPEPSTLAAQLSKHPSLALQQAQVSSRKAALALEQAEASQDLTVGGGLRFLREGSDAALVAGVSVPLPVRHRNQGNIRAARERVAGAEQTLRAAEADLRTRFAAAWQELKASHASASGLRNAVLPATEEAFAVVRDAYEQGQLPLLEVLDAQRALVSVRREILDAETAYLLALARAEGLANDSFPLTASLLDNP